MELRDYLHFKRITNINFAKDLMCTRVHLGEVLAGRKRAGKRLAKDIEILTNGEVTAQEVINLYRKEDKAI